MKLACRIAVAGVLALASAAVNAESSFHTGIALLADEQGGESQDLDLLLAPNQAWSIDAGVGSVATDSSIGRIEGTSVRAGMGVRSERFGLRGYYRSYSDSSNFESDTLGARVSVRHSSLTWSLIAETRGSEMEYTAISAGGPSQGRAHIDTNGYGLGMAYAARGWALYAEGVFYDSQSDLDSQNASNNTPALLGIPLAPQTGGSLVFKNGVLDHQLSAGVERSLRRSSMRFDWTGVEEAMSGATSNTFSAAWKYWFSSHVNIGLTAGLTDSVQGSVKFAGASMVWSL